MVHKKRPTFQKFYIDHLLADRAECCECHIYNSGLSSTGTRMWQSSAVLHTVDKRQLEHDATIVLNSSEWGGGELCAGDSIGKYCYRKVATRISIRALVCQEESFAVATKTSDNPRFHRSTSSEITTRVKPWCVLWFSDELQKVFVL